MATNSSSCALFEGVHVIGNSQTTGDSTSGFVPGKSVHSGFGTITSQLGGSTLG